MYIISITIKNKNCPSRYYIIYKIHYTMPVDIFRNSEVVSDTSLKITFML